MRDQVKELIHLLNTLCINSDHNITAQLMIQELDKDKKHRDQIANALYSLALDIKE